MEKGTNKNFLTPAEYNLPESLNFNYVTIPGSLINKYHGCGNGIATFNAETGDLIDFDYLDENGNIIEEQNVDMTENAGDIYELCDGKVTLYANFSCYQVVLF